MHNFSSIYHILLYIYLYLYILAPLSLFFRSTNTPETASLTLVNSTDGECAFSAIVSVMSKSPHRKQAIIMTENKGNVPSPLLFLLCLNDYILSLPLY